jgi:hypothetical protein
MRDIMQKGLYRHNLRNILESPLNGMRFLIIQTWWIPGDGCITTKQRVGQFYHTPSTKWKLSCNSELISSHFIDAMQIIMLYFVELSTKKRNVLIHWYLTTYYLESYAKAGKKDVAR